MWNKFKYGTNGGKDTTDKVFLLSVEDAIKRFPNDEGRKAKATEYAQKVGGAVINKKIGYSWWWLRSPGKYGYRAAEIFDSGWLDASGTGVNSRGNGVRPVIWIQKNFIESIKREKTEKKVHLSREKKEQDSFVKKEKISGDFAKKDVGSTLCFGRYPQTENGDKKPIEWIIVKKEENKALLLSKYVLDAQPYNKEKKAVTWQKSDIRSWLNSDFYTTAFNDIEQSKIADTLVLVRPENNSKYGAAGENDTEDKIFLLGIEDAESLFINNEERKATATKYAEKAGVLMNDERYSLWWLRSSGDNSYYAAEVDSYGWVIRHGNSVHYIRDGVRPALWLNL